MAVLRIEVVYAAASSARIVTVDVPAGARVRDALSASGLPWGNEVGVFGKRVSLDTPLADGDRVEIYRPLVLDPKEQRRRRAGGTAKR